MGKSTEITIGSINDRYFEELTNIMDECSYKTLYGCQRCPAHSKCVKVWDRISNNILNRKIKEPEFNKHKTRLIRIQEECI